MSTSDNDKQMCFSEEVSTSTQEQVEERYRLGNQFMHAISKGDKEAALKVYRVDDKDKQFIHRLPTDPMRIRKNLLIGLNTTCRLAAYKGGVSPVYLSILSEKFAIRIEKIQEEKDLWPVRQMMVSEYCDAVKYFSTYGYSPLIKKAVEYISLNLHNELNLEDIAAVVECHPSHLSRKFKQETKYSLPTYIHLERLKNAKFYFELGYTNITEVAYWVGYNDSNYFCRIFKKYNQMTPTEYIKNEGLQL